MGGNRVDGLRLYNFVDNHDVERIYTKLNNKAHFTPVHILLYTLPGVPSVYYGSEFGIEGKKERFSDDSLRPALSLSDYADACDKNPCTRLIAALGKVRQKTPALSYGDYNELLLTNRQYVFSRNLNGTSVLITVNNDDSDYVMTLPTGNAPAYIGALSGEKVSVNNGQITVNIKSNSGDIWLPLTEAHAAPADTNLPDIGAVSAVTVLPDTGATPADTDTAPETLHATVPETPAATVTETAPEPPATVSEPKPTAAATQNPETSSEDFEKGRIAGLQEAILAIMEKNGPVTDQMRRDVVNNVYHDSLIAWIKSFR